MRSAQRAERMVRDLLAISAIENPDAKLPDRMNGFIFNSVELLRPVETLSTSTRTPGSTPNFSAMIAASQAAANPAAET